MIIHLVVLKNKDSFLDKSFKILDRQAIFEKIIGKSYLHTMAISKNTNLFMREK